MPVFKVTIERYYRVREGFERFVEAESQNDAEDIAYSWCCEWDMDCPDDCSESGGGEAGDFDISSIELVTSGFTADDIISEAPAE